MVETCKPWTRSQRRALVLSLPRSCGMALAPRGGVGWVPTCWLAVRGRVSPSETWKQLPTCSVTSCSGSLCSWLATPSFLVLNVCTCVLLPAWTCCLSDCRQRLERKRWPQCCHHPCSLIVPTQIVNNCYVCLYARHWVSCFMSAPSSSPAPTRQVGIRIVLSTSRKEMALRRLVTDLLL